MSSQLIKEKRRERGGDVVGVKDLRGKNLEVEWARTTWNRVKKEFSQQNKIPATQHIQPVRNKFASKQLTGSSR